MVCFFPCRSELSLGDVSTSSLKGTVMVAQCDCSEYDKCECCVPSLRLNNTYIMWLKMMIGVTPLWSPLMSVKPIDIGKYDLYFKPFLMENSSRMSLLEKEGTDRKGEGSLVLSRLLRLVLYTFLSCLMPVWALVQNHTEQRPGCQHTWAFVSNQDFSVPESGAVVELICLCCWGLKLKSEGWGGEAVPKVT